MACSTLGSVKFLFMAPLILVFLFVINLMTSPGHWWVQWAGAGPGHRLGDQPVQGDAHAGGRGRLGRPGGPRGPSPLVRGQRSGLARQRLASTRQALAAAAAARPRRRRRATALAVELLSRRPPSGPRPRAVLARRPARAGVGPSSSGSGALVLHAELVARSRNQSIAEQSNVPVRPRQSARASRASRSRSTFCASRRKAPSPTVRRLVEHPGLQVVRHQTDHLAAHVEALASSGRSGDRAATPSAPRRPARGWATGCGRR